MLNKAYVVKKNCIGISNDPQEIYKTNIYSDDCAPV